ncbi:MAG: hypothetical protein K6G45_05520, partial [Lachnospiraceae bacterium]|nr:hypothetical protein [Lachnospiraceae bacterium]
IDDAGAYTKTVSPGNKAVDSFNISGATTYGITTVKTIDIGFTIYINNKIYEKTAHITTSLDDGKAFVPDLTGAQLAYEDDSFEFYIVKKGNSIKDFEYLVHNKVDAEMEVDMCNTAVNGIMAEHLGIYLGVPASGYSYTGAQYSTAISLWSALDDEIKEKGFDNVQKLSADLRVFLTPSEVERTNYDVSGVVLYSSP